ncbi:MAG TPA: bifunctional phosphoribosylaminoimidazolecarboxamide formyltransferase/IMP cyclohydrolase, partial [Cytophagales bacterium]|nr:bifunctional phosphoribosylaminoimidazolecarboxamide formyltransferase/IMP cyclohydrolase [Cytophagales bacterium]
MSLKKINSALISVYYKDNLEPIIKKLNQLGVTLYSTGGTQKFIEDLKIPVNAVEELTGFPAVFGGRVKTLHPKIFGGILYRRALNEDVAQAERYNIPPIDLVIVDLYPFEETVSGGGSHEDIIEKIDIGGISLIRAAAKNYKDVLIISSRNQYESFNELLSSQNGATFIEDRKHYALEAFNNSSHYDTAIYQYFSKLDKENGGFGENFKFSINTSRILRYGENPHQKGIFYGKLDQMFDQLNGKELSYNNLVDIDAAVGLIDEFEETTYAILKHTNACGAASANSPKEAYLKALQADPVSAFGGVIITNKKVDFETAEELNKLFFEVLIAPEFDEKALSMLTGKKNRIILRRKEVQLPTYQFKNLLNGVIIQDKDLKTEKISDLNCVTEKAPTEEERRALVFANKIVKHSKSNTIVLAKDGQLFANGVGQTSRVDALKQALEKAK